MKNKKLYKSIIILLLASCVAFAIFAITTRKFYKPNTTPTPTPTITSLPPKPAANNGEKSLQQTTKTNDGTAKDNNGQPQTSGIANSNQWMASASGNITVKNPITKSTVKSGFNLYGSAKLSQVQYRLIDDRVGVISRGFISVVSGSFSADVNFQPKSNSGRLDVFTTDDNGVESNEVQIPLNF